MNNEQAWAIITLLATLNLQHINLKEKFGSLRLRVRKLEDFAVDQLGFILPERKTK